jgi:hypothetical protein
LGFRQIHGICWRIIPRFTAAGGSQALLDQEPYPVRQVHHHGPVVRELRLGIEDSNGWGLPRYMTLLVVLGLHLALIAALVMTSRTRSLPASPVRSVELLYLPPVVLPKVRSEMARPRSLSWDTAITVSPPLLGSASVPMSSPPASSSDGKGSGVDWAAEARRALHAFDIRSHQPPSNNSVSSEPGDEWLRQVPRHAGEQIKTANGDWIVWINANCYQVARSGSGIYVPGATLPQTICRDQSGTAVQ